VFRAWSLRKGILRGSVRARPTHAWELNRYISVDSGRPSGRPDNEAFCNESRRFLTIRQNFEHSLLLRQKIGDNLALFGYQIIEFRLNSLFVAVVIERLREMLTQTSSKLSRP
jgi:hypothetical protein